MSAQTERHIYNFPVSGSSQLQPIEMLVGKL